jgi:hypothetical protein
MLVATTAVRPVLILLHGCLLLVKIVTVEFCLDNRKYPPFETKLVSSIFVLLFAMHILFCITVDY